MTYSEMVQRISEGTLMKKSHVDAVLKTFISQTKGSVALGRTVVLPGFGKFVRKVHKPRKMKMFGPDGKRSETPVEVTPKPSVSFKPYTASKFNIAVPG